MKRQVRNYVLAFSPAAYYDKTDQPHGRGIQGFIFVRTTGKTKASSLSGLQEKQNRE
jgi:hypothetical protein